MGLVTLVVVLIPAACMLCYHSYVRAGHLQGKVRGVLGSYNLSRLAFHILQGSEELGTLVLVAVGETGERGGCQRCREEEQEGRDLITAL